jgi:hypothetical protein
MTLKRLALILVLPLAAAVAFAQQPPPNPEPPAGSNQPPATDQARPPQAGPADTAAPSEPETTGTREVSAEVVSTDAAAKSIRVKVLIKKDGSSEPEQKEAAISVDPEAASGLGSVNPGDKVKLLCRMSGNKVVAVKEIKKENAEQSNQ